MASEYELNEEQQAVVDCNDKNIVCIAGAGSGKTFTMIERIYRLVKEGADPSSIIALTFTNAAGVEMKTRYRNRVNDDVSKLPDFRTFHGFCYNLLCTDIDVLRTLGYNSPPSIADDKLIKKLKAEIKHDTGIDISDKMLKSDKPLTPKQEYNRKRYNQLLRKKFHSENTITFDELCESVCDLFIKDDTAIKKYKDKFKYIFIDEFQDTDPVQWKFATSFKDANLFVCGDICQGIYSFRNADSSIMKRLLTDDNWTTLKITRNYRSTKQIVNYANYIVSLIPNHIQMKTDVEGDRVKEVNISTKNYNYKGMHSDSRSYLIRWIKQYKENPYDGSIAILDRTNARVDEIKEIFENNDLEYTENTTRSEIPYILKSLSDNEYMILWAASYLKNEDYIRFLRCESVGYPNCSEDDSHSTKFYKVFGSKFSEIKYRLDTVAQIRSALSDDNLSDREKCSEVFRLLDIKHDVEDVDLSTPQKIVEYVESVYEQSSNSSIYIGTVHSVKGLEFDQVLLFSVNDYGFDLSQGDNTNLCYVGVTRAKKHLTLFLHAY